MQAILKCGKFKEFVNYLAQNGYEEGELTFSKDGLEFYQISDNMIYLVKKSIPASEFKELHIEKKVKLGVNLAFLNRVLKAFDRHKDIEISKEKNKVSVKQGAIKINLNLIAIEKQEIPRLPPEGKTKVTVKTKALQEALKKAVLFNDTRVTLKANGSFIIETSSDDTGKYEEVIETSLQEGEEAEVIANPEFLYNLLDEEKITISIEKEKPIKIEGENLTCWLAPCLDIE